MSSFKRCQANYQGALSALRGSLVLNTRGEHTSIPHVSAWVTVSLLSQQQDSYYSKLTKLIAESRFHPPPLGYPSQPLGAVYANTFIVE